MSKAEDRYLEHFLDGRLRNCCSKEAFLSGYHQAEKDLELTWEDMLLIDTISSELLVSIGNADDKKLYQEVLKRFKNLKK
jgi:hypothetical protein